VDGGDHCWFKRSAGKERAVTRDKIIIIINLRKLVVSGIKLYILQEDNNNFIFCGAATQRRLWPPDS
jgi:hypothetical protein